MQLDSLQTTLALVARSAAGSDQAFTELFERCVDGVRHSALLRLGAVGEQYRSEVDDVIQEVFAEAFARIGRGAFDAARTDGGFRSYLAEVVKGKVVDLLRRRNALRRGEGKVIAFDALDSAAQLAFQPNHLNSPSSALQRDEAAAELRAALLHLKAEYRRALDLHDLCQMSYEEVAEQMGYQKVEPVRLLVHRARAALARRLGRTDKP